jgi:acyl CoA:acetate/3-ketoacid CoA transferase beta subunit
MMDMLNEYQMDIQNVKTEIKNTYIAKCGINIPKYYCQHLNSDSEEGTLIISNLSEGHHAFWFCNHIKLASNLLKQSLFKMNISEHSNKKASS